MINKRVLILDIETEPLLAYVWGLKDQNIALNQIFKDWQIMAYAAKWLNEAPVFYDDKRHDKTDKRLLKGLWKLLNEADIVITQNGKRFDGPRITARFIENSMPPHKPYKHWDTYLMARSVADFTSHKLEYMTDKLCTKYKKLSHKNFPGMSLWTECLKGNNKAWNEMKEYNIHDVLSTEELYTKIRAWQPASMPQIYQDNKDRLCPLCGKFRLQKRGLERLKTATYQRMQCQNCHGWSRGSKIKEPK